MFWILSSGGRLCGSSNRLFVEEIGWGKKENRRCGVMLSGKGDSCLRTERLVFNLTNFISICSLGKCRDPENAEQAKYLQELHFENWQA